MKARRAIRKTFQSVVTVGCATIVGAIAVATPASAANTGAYRDNFNGRNCDAMVYVSDETASGQVEAFGGYNCPSTQRLSGDIVVALFRNGTQVCEKGRSFSLQSTSHAECAVADPSGNQQWHAKLRIITVDTSAGLNITTGQIAS